MSDNKLSGTVFLRLPQIIGDRTATPPIDPIIPVSECTWWDGIRSGRFPKPIKIGPRVTVWRAEDIRDLIDRLCREV